MALHPYKKNIAMKRDQFAEAKAQSIKLFEDRFEKEMMKPGGGQWVLQEKDFSPDKDEGSMRRGADAAARELNQKLAELGYPFKIFPEHSYHSGRMWNKSVFFRVKHCSRWRRFWANVEHFFNIND